MDVLVVVVLVIACGFATLNYAAERFAAIGTRKAVLFLSMAPPLIFSAYAAIEFGLAVATNDRQYFGADIGLAVAIVGTIIWIPVVYVGAWLGRASKDQ